MRLVVSFALLLLCPVLRAQSNQQDAVQPPASTAPPRALGVIPNYRLADANQPFQPITAKRKLYIAWKDSTDFPVYPTAGAFAAIYHLQDQNPSFGQGFKGYAHRYATAYADQVIGNFMIEGFLPIAFHEDPRYFAIGRGNASKKSRLWYAATRIFVNRTDKGNTRFNFSEWVGNAAMAGIGNAYYPDSRRLEDNLRRMYVALGTDSLGFIIKEFSPDIKRAFTKK